MPAHRTCGTLSWAITESPHATLAICRAAMQHIEVRCWAMRANVILDSHLWQSQVALAHRHQASFSGNRTLHRRGAALALASLLLGCSF